MKEIEKVLSNRKSIDNDRKLIEIWEEKQKSIDEENRLQRLNYFAKIHIDPIHNFFEAVNGGETTLYYLKLWNDRGEVRYKVGVTLQSIEQRYKEYYRGFIVLFEEKLTHANTIEKNILRYNKNYITHEKLLGTKGKEIFSDDILRLDSDNEKTNKYKLQYNKYL